MFILPCRILPKTDKTPRRTTPWVTLLIAGLSPWRTGFNPGPVHVGFTVDKVRKCWSVGSVCIATAISVWCTSPPLFGGRRTRCKTAYFAKSGPRATDIRKRGAGDGAPRRPASVASDVVSRQLAAWWARGCTIYRKQALKIKTYNSCPANSCLWQSIASFYKGLLRILFLAIHQINLKLLYVYIHINNLFR